MPRKSKDELKTNIVIEESATTKAKKASGTRTNKRKLEETSSKVATTKSTTKKVTTRSKATSAKTATKKSTDTQESVATKKSIATKGSATKKSSSKTTKKTSTKTSTAGKASKAIKTSKSTKITKATKAAKNSRTAKIAKTSKSTKSSKTKSITSQVEYYDLPYRYNETVVKILAQTPTTLFIYWDIADTDRKNFTQKYGDDFFEKTKPVLVVYNKTMNYHFEVEINDFANSWYLHVNDANCDYSVELGRRPYEAQSPIENYVYVTTSNDMEMPNNRILFDRLGKTVFFKNIKNNFVEEKDISSISFIKNLGKVYHIYELYKEMYKDEINIEELNNEDIKLNLSSSSSSTFR